VDNVTIAIDSDSSGVREDVPTRGGAMHRTRLKWKTDPDREEYDSTGWEVRHTGAYIRVTGRCPRCHASGQSEFTNADGEFGDALVEPDTSTPPYLRVLGFAERGAPSDAVVGHVHLATPSDYVVMMECQCGDDVHAKGKNGCGARWNVRVPHV